MSEWVSEFPIECQRITRIHRKKLKKIPTFLSFPLIEFSARSCEGSSEWWTRSLSGAEESRPVVWWRTRADRKDEWVSWAGIHHSGVLHFLFCLWHKMKSSGTRRTASADTSTGTIERHYRSSGEILQHHIVTDSVTYGSARLGSGLARRPNWKRFIILFWFMESSCTAGSLSGRRAV